jgi:hypothetical protein
VATSVLHIFVCSPVINILYLPQWKCKGYCRIWLHTRHAVGLLWTSDQTPIPARLITPERNILALSGIFFMLFFFLSFVMSFDPLCIFISCLHVSPLHDTQHKHACPRYDSFYIIVLCFYFSRTSFVVLIVLHFAFCLYLLQHKDSCLRRDSNS